MPEDSLCVHHIVFFSPYPLTGGTVLSIKEDSLPFTYRFGICSMLCRFFFSIRMRQRKKEMQFVPFKHSIASAFHNVIAYFPAQFHVFLNKPNFGWWAREKENEKVAVKFTPQSANLAKKILHNYRNCLNVIFVFSILRPFYATKMTGSQHKSCRYMFSFSDEIRNSENGLKWTNSMKMNSTWC